MKIMAFFAFLLGASLGAAHAEEPPPFVLVKTISVSGLKGRIDHMCIDTQKERLYIAALSNDSLEVIDLSAGKWMRSIPGIRGPRGVMVLPESHEVVVTSGEDGAFRLYDEKLNLLRFLNGLIEAGNVRYDSATDRAYLGYGEALAVIDPKSQTKLVDVPLSGHPESFQVEKDGGSIYVNIPESQEVAVIDKGSLKITAHWKLPEARANFPMALDETHHRLFIGCRKPAKVLIYDTKNGSYVGKVNCVEDADDISYDNERKRVYVTGGQGLITVIVEVDPYLYRVSAIIPTAEGARTSCFEPATGTLYVAVPHSRKQRAEIRVYKAQP